MIYNNSLRPIGFPLSLFFEITSMEASTNFHESKLVNFTSMKSYTTSTEKVHLISVGTNRFHGNRGKLPRKNRATAMEACISFYGNTFPSIIYVCGSKFTFMGGGGSFHGNIVRSFHGNNPSNTTPWKLI